MQRHKCVAGYSGVTRLPSSTIFNWDKQVREIDSRVNSEQVFGSNILKSLVAKEMSM